MDNFMEFFVCPQCKAPLVAKENVIRYQAEINPNFCTKCGKEIATALAEAIAQVQESKPQL